MLYPSSHTYPSASTYPAVVSVTTLTVTPATIASTATVGQPAVTVVAPQTVTPATVTSTATVGQPAVAILETQTVTPATVASTTTLGQPTVTSLTTQVVTPAAVTSTATVGQPAVSLVGTTITLTPATVTSTATVGQPALTLVVSRDGYPGLLRWEVTSLHYPDQDAEVLARLTDVTDGEVTIPYKDARTAKVTLSIYDHKVGALITAITALRTARAAAAAMNGIDAYATMLRCYYNGGLVFWGPITEPEWNGAAGTVTLHAVDPSIRLQHHYLRLGDTGLSAGDPYFNTETDEGQLTTDYTGLRALRDAGLNTTEQTDRGVPDLGIVDGVNTADLALDPDTGEFVTLAIRRGEEVWTKMKELAEAAIAPDFELEPVDDTPGAYARLNTYNRQGDDLTDTVTFHFGFGRDNLTDFQWTPGGKIVTHAHKVSQDSATRATRADEDSSGWRGVYVTYEGTEHVGDAAVLAELAEREVETYGNPPDFIRVTLPPDVDRDPLVGRYRYGQDFAIGDTVHLEAKKGYMRAAVNARITEVRLRQPDATGVVAPELELVPSLAGAVTDEEY